MTAYEKCIFVKIMYEYYYDNNVKVQQVLEYASEIVEKYNFQHKTKITQLLNNPHSIKMAKKIILNDLNDKDLNYFKLHKRKLLCLIYFTSLPDYLCLFLKKMSGFYFRHF